MAYMLAAALVVLAAIVLAMVAVDAITQGWH